MWSEPWFSEKGVHAVEARNSQLEMAQVLQKPVFALPGCQQMSVNTLLRDISGLAESHKSKETHFHALGILQKVRLRKVHFFLRCSGAF